MSDSAKKYEGFTAEEKAAVKARTAELKAEAKRGSAAAKAEEDLKNLLETIAEMPPSDRKIAQRLHDGITKNVPELAPKTWYGQPAYMKDGKVLCFFQSSAKFNTRYSTFGFSDLANLDDGTMWQTSFGITELTDADEKKLIELVTKAAS
jgi:uncharacterized protein YdhG (YjbR/CyaY superfamily)